jgi:hypothetical protein
MRTHFPPEWRTQTKWKRRFYAKYMKWLEWLGYAAVVAVIGAFIVAFNVRVDDIITADGVALRASAATIKADEPTLIVRQLAPNFSEVQAGDPLLEVVTGADAISRKEAWEAATSLGVQSPIPRPLSKIIKAPKGGVFVALDSALKGPQEAEAPLAEIRDYTHLVASASLTGQGTPKAKPGGKATLKGIAVELHHGILVRGQTPQGSLVSSQMAPQALFSSFEKSLAGRSFKVREDLDLQFTSLTDVQIDAQLETQDGPGAKAGIWMEPSALVALTAQVVSGQHSASLQFAKLPAEIREGLHREITAALRQDVTTVDGRSVTISEVRGINTVIKVKAAPGEDSALGASIPATAISRAFEAELRIDSPPPYLIEAIKSADRAGKRVTAKVELKTGDRPIATLLLRRS